MKKRKRRRQNARFHYLAQLGSIWCYQNVTIMHSPQYNLKTSSVFLTSFLFSWFRDSTSPVLQNHLKLNFPTKSGSKGHQRSICFHSSHSPHCQVKAEEEENRKALHTKDVPYLNYSHWYLSGENSFSTSN